MSYIIIPVYSVACDSRMGCTESIDVTPGNQREGSESLLDALHRLIEEEDGWAVRKRASVSIHLCPKHKDEPEQAEPAKRGKCPYCSRPGILVNKSGRLRNHAIKGTGRRCGGSGHRPA